tara:strand:- start:87 stop:353 length:267 start_codon:yes stop_codon:yes gene_type:complete
MAITTRIKEIVKTELSTLPKQKFRWMEDREAQDYFVSRAINDALLSLSVSVLYPDNYASPKDMVEQIVGKVEADIVKIIRGWPPLKKA